MTKWNREEQTRTKCTLPKPSLIPVLIVLCLNAHYCEACSIFEFTGS